MTDEIILGLANNHTGYVFLGSVGEGENFTLLGSSGWSKN